EIRNSKSEKEPVRIALRNWGFVILWPFVIRVSDLLLAFVPLQALRDDIVHFLLGQLGIHRERDAGGGVALGVSDRAGYARAFAPWITGLLMDGDGVMGFSVNRGIVQELDERIAMFGLLGFDDIEVEDVAIAFALDW